MRGVTQLFGNLGDVVVGGCEWRRLQKISIRKPAVRDPVGLGGPPLNGDVDVELDRGRHPRREHVHDHVAEPIP